MFDDMRPAMEYESDSWANEFEGLKWAEWEKMLPDMVWNG